MKTALPIPALIAASLVLSVGMGVRQSFGLFLQPMTQDLGLSLSVLSLSMALQQLVWGLFQPLAGMAADRFGAAWVLGGGLALYALGLAVFCLGGSDPAAYLGIGLLMGIAVSACGFAVVLSAVAKVVPPERRSLALGIASAGGSFGQFAFAPISSGLIDALGWSSTLWLFAAIMLATMPLGLLLNAARTMDAGPAEPETNLDQAIWTAFRDPSYRLLTFGFFICGFHVSFIATHLPGVIASCLLPASVGATSLAILGIGNMIGSYGIGWLGQFYRLKHLLSALYLARALTILIFMAMPKTSLTFLILAGALGITWLSTVAPTNGLVAKLHGARHVSTLFGITYFVHQIGGFIGAWAGGLSYVYFGTYDPVWIAGSVLALMAAIANWPIKEASPLTQAATA